MPLCLDVAAAMHLCKRALRHPCHHGRFIASPMTSPISIWGIIDDLFGSDWIDSDGHDLYIGYLARLTIYSIICETRQSALDTVLSDS